MSNSSNADSYKIYKPNISEDMLIPIEASDKWFDCENANQCVIVDDMSCGLVSVNIQFASDFHLWALNWEHRNAPQKCMIKNRTETRYFPVCFNSKCSTELIK